MGNSSGGGSKDPAYSDGQGQGGPAAFSFRQRQALLKRYQAHDSSPNGTRGIPIDVCVAMPEFVGNKLIAVLIHDYVNASTGRLHPQEFVAFCNFLSMNTTPREKKSVLFDSFDVYGTERFTHDEVFRLYKILLGHVISDDLILALTFEALKHPSLRKEGELTKEEFIRLVPDSEIEEKLTLYFNIPDD